MTRGAEQLREALLERLRAKVDSGRRTLGGGTISSDGRSTTWGNERVMVLANRDGPEAANLIESLAAEIAALTPSSSVGAEGSDLSYDEQALADGEIDFLEQRADEWMEECGVQRMFNAIASVFEKHAPQEIMDRFREKLGVIGRQCYVEGALRVWEEIAAQQRALGHPLPTNPAAPRTVSPETGVEG